MQKEENSVKRLKSEQWTEYWNQAAITSFHSSCGGNYDKEFALFWERQWEYLKTNECIVDLCTGNGAVALLAAKFASKREQNLRIVGVDSADIKPAITLNTNPEAGHLLSSIEFISNTRIEELPFDSGSIDLVASQYGYEYADTAKAAKEVSRVTRQGGRLAIISHNTQSVVANQGRDALGILQHVLREQALGEKIIALLQQLQALSNANSETKTQENKKCATLRDELNLSIKTLNNLDQQYQDCYMLDYAIPQLMAVFRKSPTQSSEARIAIVRDVLDELNFYEKRMTDLLSAALEQSAFSGMLNTLEANGFAIEGSGPFYYNKNQLMGWQIQARKN